MRVALYARVSTRDQNLDLQLDELRAAAKLSQFAPWPLEYIDHGVSGAAESRPALDALMAAARAGELQAVMVWRFDRFARSVTHLLAALDTFRQLGVEFVSLRERLDTRTPMGRAVFTILAAMAEMERGLIRERTLAGLDAARRRGVQVGRPRRMVDRSELNRLRDGGRSIRGIAAELGVSPTTLRRRLRLNPVI